jgi:hypothetical protein
VKELREALEGKEISSIKTTTEKLSKILQEISAAVYQKTQQQQPPPSSDQKDKKQQGNQRVVDADYTVEDEKKT